MKEGVSTSQTGEWVAIREAHIKHESSLRSVGLLYYLAAFFMVIGSISMLTTLGMATDSLEGSDVFMLVFAIVYVVLGVITIVVGRGYRKLKRWVRIPGTILAVLGLLSIPIGTLINGYVLYLLHSEKGRTVFSEVYQDIREATPEVVYRSSKMAWIILALLLVGIFGLIAYFSMIG